MHCVFNFHGCSRNSNQMPSQSQSVKKITIKTERQIEQQLGIKQEAPADDDNHEERTNVSMSEAKSALERQKLLEAFASLKTENQKMTFDLKKKNEECVKLHADMKSLKNEIVSTKAVVSELEIKVIEYEQKNSKLLHENRILSARTKQLQTGTMKQEKENTIDEDEDVVYEVEKLIDDKMIRNIRYFRVRWKGYTPNDDTWERESNLKCAAILNKYLETKPKS